MAITVEWIEPKTDWNANSDKLNIGDYNRIKNNLTYLHEYANELYVPFDTEDMGEDATYPIFWDVDKFNAFERNLDEINKKIYTQDFGVPQTFYPNGVFIQADELNRIESAMLSMKDVLDRQKEGVRRLPFRLGQYRINRFQYSKQLHTISYAYLQTHSGDHITTRNNDKIMVRIEE